MFSWLCRIRGASAAGLVVVAALFVAPGAAGGSPGPKPPVRVPITIHGGQTSPNGAEPFVKVKVARGRKVPILLDTGSVGLHIYAPGVKTGPGSGVTITKCNNPVTGQLVPCPDLIAYVDGAYELGVIAKGKVTIGGVTTPKPIRFGLITKVGCLPGYPHCPVTPIKMAIKRGNYGVMGVRFQAVPAGQPPNPLMKLPGRYGRSWSIGLSGSAGTLVLGAPAPTKPAAVIHLTGGKVPKAIVCWTVGSISNVCARTLFDSGDAAGTQLFGGKLGQAPTKPGSNRVVSGTNVSAALPGKPSFWSFTSGNLASKNAVTAHRSGRGTVNTGVQAFFAFTITFDTAHRTMSLSPSRVPGPTPTPPFTG